MPFLLFYTTHPDEVTARQISNTLVERRLAACANIFPISSAYWWQGAVQQKDEWVSVLKTRLELETTLEKAVQALHPYDVPCGWKRAPSSPYRLLQLPNDAKFPGN
jgi:periplasmic divalent cation tolerance protein